MNATTPPTPIHHIQWGSKISSANSRRAANHAIHTTAADVTAAGAEIETASTDIITIIGRTGDETIHETTRDLTDTSDTAIVTTMEKENTGRDIVAAHPSATGNGTKK